MRTQSHRDQGENTHIGLGVGEGGWGRDKGSFHASIYKNQKLGGKRNDLKSVPSSCISELIILVFRFCFIFNLFY